VLRFFLLKSLINYLKQFYVYFVLKFYGLLISKSHQIKKSSCKTTFLPYKNFLEHKHMELLDITIFNFFHLLIWWNR